MLLHATRKHILTSAIHTSKCLSRTSLIINRSQLSSAIKYATSTNQNTFRLPLQTSPPFTHIQQHGFTTTASRNKKKDKNKRNDDAESSSSTAAAAAAGSDTADPFDFSQLQSGVSDALARLKDDLQKLRTGGRLNPETIEQLRVNLVKGKNETVRLSEVAQVVPKGGRSVAIIVGEEDVRFSLSLD